MKTTLIQKSKAGRDSGSLMNYLMGNNKTIPEVGKGATILHWTDRSAYEVIKVSKDLTEVTLQRYDAERKDDNGMSECQSYQYEKLTNEIMNIKYLRGAWRKIWEEVHFTKNFLDNCPRPFSLTKSLTEEQRQVIYQGGYDLVGVLPGVTYKKKCSSKINILFGEKDEYYDFSF